ncbi:MAG TPA: acyltransferase [Amycolatopsis sp.]|nr:acyltransferase [Amycolatopsis sp.]
MVATERDRYVDWLRAVSLVVVVLWHWAFTILRWTPGGPQPTNPLGFFSGLWIFTWLLQVMPLFFYVGGYAHLVSWQRAQARGTSLARYIAGHIRPLLVPALGLVGTWALLGTVLGSVYRLSWARNAVMLVISPLWFLGVYVVLIALLPVTLWLHRKLDVLALVLLGGIAMIVDVLRFRFGFIELGWINMAVVWMLAHQAGFFYRRLVDAPRRLDLSLLFAGLFALVGLVFSGLYPGSMVGVPGDRLSNMAPPTFVIVALLTFQAGFAEVVRPPFERWLGRPRPARFTAVMNRYALPLFLFHTTGMAIARAADYFVFRGRIVDDRPPDLVWWAERPIAVLVPLLFTVPLIFLFSHHRAAKTRRPIDDASLAGH